MKKEDNWLGSPGATPKEYLTVVDILGTNSPNEPGNNVNSTTLTLGVAFTGETYTSQALLYSQPGILSVPLGPGTVDNTGTLTSSATSSTAAQAVAFVRNDQWIALATRDTRNQFTGGNLAQGETAVYAPGSSARTTYALDGSVTNFTLAADGYTGVYMQISPTGLTFVSPFGTMIFDATGFHINTTSGASFHMGAPPGIPSPFSALIGNYCSINAQSTTISSPFLTLGDLLNPPFISASLPLTITAPAVFLGTPALVLGDVTTPCAVTSPSILSIAALGALTIMAPDITIIGVITEAGQTMGGSPAVGLPLVV